MNTQEILDQLNQKITEIKGAQFASLTYLSKESKELARYTVILGFSYHKAVEKSITELEILIAENSANWNDLQKQAASEVMASLQKTMAAHAKGQQNADYTKKGMYRPISNGLNVNMNDGTVQLFGLVQSKVSIQPGEYKKVNSSELTIAKNKIRKQLTVSKFREFALDAENVNGAKVNGDVLEMA